MRQIPLLAALAALSAALALAGCVTETIVTPAAESASGANGAAGAPSSAGGAPAAPAEPEDPVKARDREFELGRTLLSLDRRVDEFVFLGTQPGEKARDDRAVAQSAIEAVTTQYLDRLLVLVADPDDPARRRIAAKSLGFTTDRRATPALIDCLRSNDAVLQTGAAFAIARRRDPDTPLPPLLDAARAADVDVRVIALLALWHVLGARAEAGKPLDPAARDAVLPVLETALFDPDDPMVRAHAAAAMGALGDPRAVDPLLNVLRDEHPAVRTHTALALGKLGDRRAIRPLVDVIDETPRGSPRGAVLLGISLLLEHEGIATPPDMPDTRRAWSDLIQRVLPAAR